MEELLTKQFGDRLKKDFDLSPYFTLKMKTRAEFYIEASSIDEWREIARVTLENDIPLFILGGGSNIAVLKNVIPGLVVRNRYMRKEVISETDEYIDVLFSSGYPMSLVVKETTESGWSGFEYHLGLPGTLGGAIYMNSKWTKPVTYVGDTLLTGTIMNKQGNVRTEQKEYFSFAYDYSKLQDTKEIFLEGVFRLRKEDSSVLKMRAQEALAYRKETQPFGVATGGCFFQNISQEEKESHNLQTTSAGYLIDHAGLKGKRIGGFVVSDKHANFVINTGDGTPEDLNSILQLIKETVKEKFGVELKEEVQII
ncbi:UDP-N-acetylmuramate dehydrogenase [Candidatus Roizmanbacteria bacterium]|nr:MAG: UDP-N-acetylmuramate dehydrogenase [Candidatus Roizmanbacteria bacterium]